MVLRASAGRFGRGPQEAGMNALKIGVSIPKNCCIIPFRIPERGASSKIHAMFFMIGGIKIG